MFSFGCFPGAWVLIADVSEPSIGSIFIGRSMQYDSGWDVWGIYTWQVQAGRSRGQWEGEWPVGGGYVMEGGRGI
jgi:hypothetical protein